MKIAILVLHYKNTDDTTRCLNSLIHAKKGGHDISLILINNDPACDITKEFASKDIIIIDNRGNLGFAKGMNRGITYALKQLNPDYIVLLNNDTRAPDNFFTSLFKTDLDIVGPVIQFTLNGKTIFDYGGVINWWTGRTTHYESNVILHSVQHLNKKKILKRVQDDNTFEIDYVSGCCMAVKRNVFDKIGLLDEWFFFYFEDVDFCTRARKAGFHIGVNKDTVVVHVLSGSIGRWSSKAIYYSLIGNCKFILKHRGIRIPVGLAYLGVLTFKIVWDKLCNRNQELVS